MAMIVSLGQSICLKLGGVQPCDSLYHVVGYLWGGLLGEDFLVLVQYVSVDAQGDATRQYLGPYLMIRTAGGQCLQQAVGVKDDAPHSRRECACALRPIVRWSAR